MKDKNYKKNKISKPITFIELDKYAQDILKCESIMTKDEFTMKTGDELSTWCAELFKRDVVLFLNDEGYVIIKYKSVKLDKNHPEKSLIKVTEVQVLKDRDVI